MNAKFDWDTQADTHKYQGFLGASIVLGMTIGAVCGGKLMTIGRRRAILIACPIGMVGLSLTLYRNFFTFMIGRFIFGFSVGLFSTICPRFIEEIIPLHLYSNMCVTFNFAQCIGNMCAYFLGAILPEKEWPPSHAPPFSQAELADKAVLQDTSRWKIIYFYFPMCFYTLTFFGFLMLL